MQIQTNTHKIVYIVDIHHLYPPPMLFASVGGAFGPHSFLLYIYKRIIIYKPNKSYKSISQLSLTYVKI